MFLTDAELVQLTGRKLKSKQLEWLRTQGLAHRVNATGHPVVTWSAVDGHKDVAPPPRAWTPRVLASNA